MRKSESHAIVPHMQITPRIFALFLCLASILSAQSTFGVVVGTVRDSSGAIVSGATVKLTNLGENTSRDTMTAPEGDYEFQNVKPGNYSVVVSHAGFRSFRSDGLTLVARQTLRVNAALQVGEVTETVSVQAAAGVIATDSPAIGQSLDSLAVVNLPSNLRAGGNTTPYNLIATLPGVQPDNGNAFSIQGGLPAQTETS